MATYDDLEKCVLDRMIELSKMPLVKRTYHRRQVQGLDHVVSTLVIARDADEARVLADEALQKASLKTLDHSSFVEMRGFPLEVGAVILDDGE